MIVTQYTACNLLASFTRPQKVLEEEQPGIEASNLYQPYQIHTGLCQLTMVDRSCKNNFFLTLTGNVAAMAPHNIIIYKCAQGCTEKKDVLI